MKLELIKTTECKRIEQELQIDLTPSRANAADAGYDLRACIRNPVTIRCGESIKISTGHRVYIGSITDGEFDVGVNTTLAGLVIPRSGTNGLELKNVVGVIDSGYQGEIFLKIVNKSNKEDLTIQPGQRVFQMVIVPAFTPTITLVDEFTKTTDRGSNGFNSTGDF